MRNGNTMCRTMPVMPFMAVARMSWSAWSCGAKAMRTAMATEAGREAGVRAHERASENEAPRPRAKNVVETAQAAGSFSSLLGALKAAGLDLALEGAGPFTVFAPSDEAFAKVPAEALRGLLSNPVELAKVLKYHVVSGRLTSAELGPVGSLRTLEGRSLTLDLSQGKVGGARVVKSDVLCSNGVIHVIDSVLLPA
jgi:uncharacterized surface protein with fasciclin (FAS1) repeats